MEKKVRNGICTDGIPIVMLEARQNIVLGCATDYSAEQIAPFVSTLRSSGFRGELALVIYTDQKPLLAGLGGEFNINFVPISRAPGWLPAEVGGRLRNRGRMRWVHRSLATVLADGLRNPIVLNFTGYHLQHFLHIACGRYLSTMLISIRAGIGIPMFYLPTYGM